MKKLAVVVGAGMLFLGGCGGADAQEAAKKEAESRGFSFLSTDGGGVISPAVINVGFGEKGCTGTFEYTATDRVLRADVPDKGEIKVDDARVDTLRNNPVFEACFEEVPAK